MKAEFLNPFINSVTHIIESTVGETPARGKIFLRGKYPYTTAGVIVMVGITGVLTGQVLLSLSEECAKGLAAKMLMEDVLFEFDEYAQSALAEMANMIAANATIGLSEAGYSCNITPPSVITGKQMEISCQEHIQTIVIPMECQAGGMELNLSMIETNLLAAAGKDRILNLREKHGV